jgi:hypothetical protein
MEPEGMECDDGIRCGDRRELMRMTVNGESARLRTGESADLAGLRFWSGAYRRPGCGNDVVPLFHFGAYALP